MVCEVCGFEHSEFLCPKCGWENAIVLDDDYQKYYELKKEKYKELFNNKSDKFDKFMDRLSTTYNRYLTDDPNLAKIFIDDILMILKDIDEKNYIEFYMAKIYLLIKTDKDKAKDEIKKLKQLPLSKQQLEIIEKWEKVL